MWCWVCSVYLRCYHFPFQTWSRNALNQLGKLEALAPLLIIDLEKGLKGLQLFGDYELKIDWEKGNHKCINYSYSQFLIRSISWWVDSVFYLSSMFTGNTSCRQIGFQSKNWSCWRSLGASGRWRGHEGFILLVDRLWSFDIPFSKPR